MSFYSILEYVGDNSTVSFTAPPHLDSAHLTATVDGLASAWTISGTLVTFSTPPAGGAVVRIQRNTSPEARLTNYTNGAGFREINLDQDSLQAFYLAQEGLDRQAEYAASAGGYPTVDGEANAAAIGVLQTELDAAEAAIGVLQTELDIAEAAIDVLEAQAETNVVYVKTASDLSGALDSTIVYKIDGIINLIAQTILVPAGGLTIVGNGTGVSKLTSVNNSYTMFTDSGTAGELNLMGVTVTASGTGSQVFDLTNGGTSAVTFTNVNFDDCTSLGTLNGYRQGLEINTGRFGGSPLLTLAGSWSGYRITTSILRGITDSASAIFISGASFAMTGRMKMELNYDLPASMALMDFADTTFTGTVELTNCSISRAGAFDASDTNITPNLNASDTVSLWRNNKGIPNTFVGATRTMSSTTGVTSISVINTAYEISGSWTLGNEAHFDSTTARNVRHLGESPREFRFEFNGVVTGTTGDDLIMQFWVWDDSAGTYSSLISQRRTILSSGSIDVASFNMLAFGTLDINDHVHMRIVNASAARDVTMLEDAIMSIQER